MGGERHTLTHKKKLRSEHGGVKSGNMGISGWVYAEYKKQNTIDLGFDPDCRSSQHMEDVYKIVHIVHLEANLSSETRVLTRKIRAYNRCILNGGVSNSMIYIYTYTCNIYIYVYTHVIYTYIYVYIYIYMYTHTCAL